MTNAFQRKVALAIIPKCTAFLSLLGSSYIIQDIVRDSKKWHKSTYHRLMFGISFFDILASVANILSTWPTPAEQSSAIFLASGNTATCTAQGFINELGNMTTPIYTAALCMRSLLILKYEWNERDIRRYEWLFHAAPLLIGLAMSIVGLPLTLYNNSGWLCWYAPYPRGCDADGSCTRGHYANTFRWVHYGFIWSAIVFVTIGMILIYMKVRQQEAKCHQFISDYFDNPSARLSTRGWCTGVDTITKPNCNRESSVTKLSEFNVPSSELLPSPTSATKEDDDDGVPSIAPSPPRGEAQHLQQQQQQRQQSLILRKNRDKSRRVAVQSFLYILPCMLHGPLQRIFQTAFQVTHFPLLLLMAIFFPLQGFWNAFIYVRPHYVEKRRRARLQSQRRLRNGSSCVSTPILSTTIPSRLNLDDDDDDNDVNEERQQGEQPKNCSTPSVDDSTPIGCLYSVHEDAGSGSDDAKNHLDTTCAATADGTSDKPTQASSHNSIKSTAPSARRITPLGTIQSHECRTNNVDSSLKDSENVN